MRKDQSYPFALDYLDREGKKQVLHVVNPFRGTLVVGGAGSGKTATFANAFICEAVDMGFAGIIYDFKFPDLANVARTAYVNSSHPKKATQYYINFEHPAYSHKVNPLHPRYIKTIAHAEEYALVILANLVPESIKKSDFWQRSAIALLQASIWFFKEEHPEKCNLPYIVNFIQSDTTRMLETLRSNATCARLISSILTALDKRAQTQLAAIIGTLQIALNKINIPAAAEVLSGDEVDLNLNDPNDPKLLIIGNSHELKETNAPLISLICAVALKLMNAPDKCPSLVLLDEAPTLYIPNLEDIPATGRSRKIAVVYMTQDLAQVTDKFGKDKKDALLANLMNQFYGRVVNFETADYVSRLFGRQDYLFQSKNTSHGKQESREDSDSSHHGINENWSERPVLPAAQITGFEQGQFASILAEPEPHIAHAKVRYYLPTFYQKADLHQIKLDQPDNGIGDGLIGAIAEDIAMNILVAKADVQKKAAGSKKNKQTRLKF